jgi:DNA polymerase III subunit epsilon
VALPESGAPRAYRDTPFPPDNTPWREAEFAVVDLELTGLDPAVHEIVSFATVTVAQGRVRLEDARYRIVRPSRMPDPDSIRIHGLRESDLAQAPPLDEALSDLLEALTGRVLVAHVAAVDTGFLRAAFEARGLGLQNPIVDTAELALEMRRLQRLPPVRRDGDPSTRSAVSSPGLSDLARSLGLPVHRPHHADGDALTTAQVFLALATHLDRIELMTVGALERLSRTPRERVSLRSLLGRFGLGRSPA